MPSPRGTDDRRRLTASARGKGGMSTGRAFALRFGGSIGPASFADKSAKQPDVFSEYRPNFPRNSTNTFHRCDVSMKSPPTFMGRERETSRHRHRSSQLRL